MLRNLPAHSLRRLRQVKLQKLARLKQELARLEQMIAEKSCPFHPGDIVTDGHADFRITSLADLKDSKLVVAWVLPINDTTKFPRCAFYNRDTRTWEFYEE